MWFRDELELQVDELTAREPIEKRVGPFRYMDSEKISLSSSSLESESSLEIEIARNSCKSAFHNHGSGHRSQKSSQKQMGYWRLPSGSPSGPSRASKWTERLQNLAFANDGQSQIQFTRAPGLTAQSPSEQHDDEEAQPRGLARSGAHSTAPKHRTIVPEDEETLSNHSMSQLRRLKKNNQDIHPRETSGFKNRMNGELEMIALGLDDIKGKYSPHRLVLGRRSNDGLPNGHTVDEQSRMQTPLRSQQHPGSGQNGPPYAEKTPGRPSQLRGLGDVDVDRGSQHTGTRTQTGWAANNNPNFFSAGLTPDGCTRFHPEGSAYKLETKIETQSTRSVPDHALSDKFGLQTAPDLTQPRKRNSWALRREQSMEKHISEKELQIQRNLEKSEALLKHLEEKASYLSNLEQRFALFDSETHREQQRLEEHLERVQQSKERHSKSIADLQLQIEGLKEQLAAKERLAGETKRVLKDSLEKRAQLHHTLLQTRGNLSPISGILLVRTCSGANGRPLKEEEALGFDKIYLCDQKLQDKGRLSADAGYLAKVEEVFSGFLSPLIASCVFHKSRPLAIVVTGQSARLTVVGSRDSQTHGPPGLLHRLTTCLLDLLALLPGEQTTASETTSQRQTDGLFLSVVDVLEDELRDGLATGTEAGRAYALGWQRDRVVVKPTITGRRVRSLADVDDTLGLLADRNTEKEAGVGSSGMGGNARVYRLVAGGEGTTRVTVSLVQIHSSGTEESRAQKVWGSAQKKLPAEPNGPLTPNKQLQIGRKNMDIETSPFSINKTPFGHQTENTFKEHLSEKKINKSLHTRNLDSKQVGEAIGIHPSILTRPSSELSASKPKSPISSKAPQLLSKTTAVLSRVIRTVRVACEEVKGAESWPSRINAPFRDSQLTMLLQDCLNGTGETALILTADCASTSSEKNIQLVNTQAVTSLMEAFKSRTQPNHKGYTRAYC